MRYDVALGKETYSVEISEIGGTVYEVRVDDGDAVRIDAAKTPRTVYSILIDDRQYEGSVDFTEGDKADVHVGTSAFDLTIIDERRKALSVASAAVLTGKQELRAQMPGKIVKLLVKVGDDVEAEQSLVIVEAMKMENELKSAVAGKITEIAVAEGDPVETDALLMVVEPPEDE